MLNTFACFRNEDIARRWRFLVERRRAHLSELHRSGRWKHYFKEEDLLKQLQEAVRQSEAWDRLADSAFDQVRTVRA